jgi:glycosyltransferase involved in cell wall biosynthesis
MVRFASHLPEFGWEPVVLAPGETHHLRDRTLVFPEERVIRSRSVELSRLWRPSRTGPGVPSLHGGRQDLRQALRPLAHRVAFYPDPQIGWYPAAVRAGTRAVRQQRFDAVLSSSFPITAHLIAMRISRRGGLPWAAEFRDPWSDTLPRLPYGRRAAALERKIAREAGRVIMPTPTWASHYGARWATDVAVVPNGHDGRQAPSSPAVGAVLTHVGSYSPRRQNLRALWSALARLKAEDPALVPRIRWVGPIDGDAWGELSETGLAATVEVTGFLPHTEAMRLAGASSLLVASGLVGSDHVARGCVPAKLFEYLATGLPILYIGEVASDAAALLHAHPGCRVVDPSDVDAVLAALESVRQGRTYARDVENLSRRAGARKLAEILDQACARSGAQ